MEAEGLVSTVWSEHDGRKRKYYELTDAGRKQLVERKREWNVFQTAVNRILREEPI
ncbi:Transcriptional regulator PadR-like family protein [compost metagenome]